MIIGGIYIGPLQIFLIFIMIVCAWLLVREIRTWYWKINEIVNEQRYQSQILENILSTLEQMNAPQEPEEEFINEESTP